MTFDPKWPAVTLPSPSLGEKLDLCPPEIEFARAVDRLKRESENVQDWQMVCDTVERVAGLWPAAEFNRRLAK